MSRVEYTVSPGDEGLTLGTIARRRMAVSATLLRQLKRTEGGITLEGEEVWVNVLPKAGQVISLASGRDGRSENIIPQKGEVDIVYEDEGLLIVNKPGGMPVHPSRGHEKDTLANYIAGMLEERGQQYVFRAINRLDRGTSGLMCVAKTKYSSAMLGAAMREGNIERRYLAICHGQIDPPRGTIDLPIGRAPGMGIMRQVTADGQRAVTHYDTVCRQDGYSLLDISLETGRTHQIRVHLSHIGHPLVGDFMYGEEEEGFDRVALHSYYIKISLPGREREFRVKPPESFGRFIDLSEV